MTTLTLPSLQELTDRLKQAKAAGTAEPRIEAAKIVPHFDPDAMLARMRARTAEIVEGYDDDAEKVTTTQRKRRPDFVKQVERATAAGLPVTSATITADSVVIAFGETEATAPLDAGVIETADELRKLLT